MIVMAGPVHAEKAKPKDAQEKAAKKACAVGDFQKGVNILADLFVESNDPTYVYNQGRCYQQNNHWEQAISRFREYLRKAKDLSDGDTAEVERQIGDCETSLSKATQMASPPAPATGSPPTQAEQVSEPSPPRVSTQPTPLPSDSDQEKGLRTAGIICAAVGLAMVGTGVGLALKTQSISSDEQKNGATPAKENHRKSLENWGWASYGVGAAAIITGATLCVLSWPSNRSTKVAIMPVRASDGVTVILKGNF
jgi:tetratricopeptide (TPR) repeat protein